MANKRLAIGCFPAPRTEAAGAVELEEAAVEFVGCRFRCNDHLSRLRILGAAAVGDPFDLLNRVDAGDGEVGTTADSVDRRPRCCLEGVELRTVGEHLHCA